MHRPDLNTLAPADRAELARQIQQYVTPAIVNRHFTAPFSVHTDGATFLSWHRTYIQGLENFLINQGHPEWSPLPAWDPATRIPDEFNIPNAGPDRLRDLTPNLSFSPTFDTINMGNFETDTALGNALMSPHGTVHIRVGGVMGDLRSPEAPIFWPWHSFIDDIWWEWQRVTVLTPNCIGLTIGEARQLLTSLGFTIGAVATVPHTHGLPNFQFPVSRPFPFPPQPEPPFPPRFPRPFPFPPFPWPSIRPLHSHVVVEQSPVAGDRVIQGSIVDLFLGMSS